MKGFGTKVLKQVSHVSGRLVTGSVVRVIMEGAIDEEYLQPCLQ